MIYCCQSKKSDFEINATIEVCKESQFYSLPFWQKINDFHVPQVKFTK